MHAVACSVAKGHNSSIWCCTLGIIKQKVPAYDEEGILKGETIKGIDCLITGSLDKTIKIWLLRGNLKLYKTLRAHHMAVLSVLLNSDSTMLVSSSLDAVAIVWDMPKGEVRRKIFIGYAEIWTIYFSPNEDHIITGNQKGMVNVINVFNGKLTKAIDTTGSLIISAAYSKDGKYIAAGSVSGMVYVMDTQTNKVKAELKEHMGMTVRCIVFTNDNQYILTGSNNGFIFLYNILKNFQVERSALGHSSWILSIQISPDNRHLLTSSSDCTVKIWRMEDLYCIRSFEDHQKMVWAAKYNTAGNKVVSVSEDCSIKVYDVPVIRD